MARKRGLGRGLGALIPRSIQETDEKVDKKVEEQADTKVAKQANAKVDKKVEKKAEKKVDHKVEKKTDKQDDNKVQKKTDKQVPNKVDTKREAKATQKTMRTSGSTKPSTSKKQVEKQATPSKVKQETASKGTTSQKKASLTKTAKANAPTLGIDHIETSLIKPRFNQPRKSFADDRIQELADSIRQFGIIQPIVVKEIATLSNGVKYEIIAGERRYRAAQVAGLTKVPVVVRQAAEEEAAVMSVVENVQREDLNALEEASAYQEIMNQQALTQQELADILGKSRSYIANTLRLLKLDAETLDALRKGLITSTQARTLLSIEDVAQRAKYRQLLIEGRTNIEDVTKEHRGRKVLRPRTKDIYVQEMEQRLADLLGTKVAIAKKRKGWTIQVQCYSEEDLTGFLQRLGADDGE